MSESPEPPSEEREPDTVTNVSGGVNLDAADDISIDGDVIGRDKVTQTTNITQVGMTPEAVRRLVITGGVLVFVTAVCFFSGGIVVGIAALQAVARPVASTPEKSAAFAQNLAEVNALPASQPLVWGFTEDQLSSYFRLDLGPRIGILPETGKARFLSSEEVVFYGRWSGFFNLPVTLVTRSGTDAPVLYHTQSAAVRLFGEDDSMFGSIALPAFVVQPLLDAINADIGYQVSAKRVDYPPFRPTLTGDASAEAPVPVPLAISGVKK